MTLGTRKLIVLILIGAIIVLANAWLVVKWLDEKGAVDWAEHIRTEYLTSPTVTIIVVLLILLVRPRGERAGLLRQCPVCDHVLLDRSKYCAECGSRV